MDEDDHTEVKELVGDSFMEKCNNRWLVVKGWVNLGHLAQVAIRDLCSTVDGTLEL